MLVVIDYGVGNLASVMKACKKIDASSVLSSDLKVISSATKLLLPGVGAFGDGMAALNTSGLAPVIKEKVRSGTPLMGICLGMQLLGLESEESPGIKGLNLIDFKVKRFNDLGYLKVPHVGWNEISPVNESVIFQEVKQQSDVYFVHSYHVDQDSIDPSKIIATCEYGENFVCAVQNSNVYGVQFHPEKSQKVGMKIIENFIKI